MATQHLKRNMLLNLYREGEKISPVCSLLPLKRDKNVWHLLPISSVWRPLAFLPVTLSVPNAGKIEGRRKRGHQRMRRLVCIIDAMDMNLSKFREMVRDREVWRAAVQGYTKNQTQLGDWTTTKVALKELTAKSLKERGQLPYLECIKEEGFSGSDSNAECGWGQLKGRAGQPWGMQERRRPWGGFLRTSQWKGQ